MPRVVHPPGANDSWGGKSVGVSPQLILWERIYIFYLEEFSVLSAGICSYTVAWNNKEKLRFSFIGAWSGTEMERCSWWHSYSIVRGEILGPIKDGQRRKHLPNMFSLIKNES